MNSSLNVICLPFAGGNKYSYRDFRLNSPSSINLIPLEYPGRGGRIREDLLSDTNDLVDDLYKLIVPIIENGDYAIYGHSLGGLLTYLLTKKIIANRLRPPIHLFVTGTTGPSSLSRSEKKRHLMPKKEFIQELRDLQGMPDEILASDELLEYYEPILRSDFKASESYLHESSEPLDIPITVITGLSENMTEEDIRLWQNETKQIIDFKRFPGNHFFIYNYTREIVQIITNKTSLTTKVYQV